MWKFVFVNYGPVSWSQAVVVPNQFSSQTHKLMLVRSVFEYGQEMNKVRTYSSALRKSIKTQKVQNVRDIYM